MQASQMTIVLAFRGTLTTSNAATDAVTSDILANWDHFDTGAQILFHREIKGAIELGSVAQCDQAAWKSILDMPIGNRGKRSIG